MLGERIFFPRLQVANALITASSHFLPGCVAVVASSLLQLYLKDSPVKRIAMIEGGINT